MLRPWLPALAFTLLFAPADAGAQSLIVGIPSTDVTHPGRTMIAHESQLNLWDYAEPYWSSFQFGTVGVGREMELAVTVYGVGYPDASNVVVSAGYKHRFPLVRGSPWEPTAAVGLMLPISVSRGGIGVWSYAVGSFRVPATRTRITAGASYGTAEIFGVLAPSGLLGLEQPLHRHVSLVADAFVGDHALAAVVTGVQLMPTPELILIPGFKFPLSSRAGPTAAMLEVTYEF